MSPPLTTSTADGNQRAKVATWVLAGSGLLLTATIVVVIRTDPTKAASVFNALLPLIGTWVGTVLAFYFTRENFESASKSVHDIVQLTMEEKLRALRVDDFMLRPSEISKVVVPNGKSDKDVPVQAMLDLLDERNGIVTRIPVLDEAGVLSYIIHQSLLYRFLTRCGLEAAEEGQALNISKLTLDDFIRSQNMRAMVHDSIGFVGRNATMADAKRVLDRHAVHGCQDIVVTATGGRGESLVGWLTNVEIARHARA